MKRFITFLIKNNYSKNTINTYKSVLNVYLHLFGDIRLIKKRLLEYKNSPNTILTHYNVLLSYMTFLNDKRIIKLKELKLPPVPRSYMPIFSKAYILKKTADLSIYKNVVIRLLFETGLRATELKKILEIKKDTLLVLGKGNKIREIFHNKETTKYFKGFSYSEKTLRIWVKQILGPQFSPHSIRRSHATHMLLNGANPKTVMMQLGHSKIETTYRYLQLSLKKNKQIYNKFF